MQCGHFVVGINALLTGIFSPSRGRSQTPPSPPLWSISPPHTPAPDDPVWSPQTPGTLCGVCGESRSPPSATETLQTSGKGARERSSARELLPARDTAVRPTWIGVVPWLCSALRGCLLAYLHCEEPQTSSRIQQQLRTNSLMFNSASNSSSPHRNLPHSKPNPNSGVSAAHSTLSLPVSLSRTLAISLAHSTRAADSTLSLEESCSTLARAGRCRFRSDSSRIHTAVQNTSSLNLLHYYSFSHTPFKPLWHINPHKK